MYTGTLQRAIDLRTLENLSEAMDFETSYFLLERKTIRESIASYQQYAPPDWIIDSRDLVYYGFGWATNHCQDFDVRLSRFLTLYTNNITYKLQEKTPTIATTSTRHFQFCKIHLSSKYCISLAFASHRFPLFWGPPPSKHRYSIIQVGGSRQDGIRRL